MWRDYLYKPWPVTGGKRIATSEAAWFAPLTWNRGAERVGTRPRVLCGCDPFEPPQELDAWRYQLFGLIAATPHLDWLLPTKYPAAAKQLLEAAPRFDNISDKANRFRCIEPRKWDFSDVKWPLPNLWLGVSVSTQREADERIPLLLQTPAARRFLRVEPLLESIDLQNIWFGRHARMNVLDGTGMYTLGSITDPVPNARCKSIDWVIAGGETGPAARPCNTDWLRGIVRQCKEASVPRYVTQLGTHAVGAMLPSPCDTGGVVEALMRDTNGADLSEWPEDLRVREFPSFSEKR